MFYFFFTGSRNSLLLLLSLAPDLLSTSFAPELTLLLLGHWCFAAFIVALLGIQRIREALNNQIVNYMFCLKIDLKDDLKGYIFLQLCLFNCLIRIEMEFNKKQTLVEFLV